jgi:hypothetical protein
MDTSSSSDGTFNHARWLRRHRATIGEHELAAESLQLAFDNRLLHGDIGEFALLAARSGVSAARAVLSEEDFDFFVRALAELANLRRNQLQIKKLSDEAEQQTREERSR